MPELHDRVELVSRDELIPYTNNPKEHPEEQVNQIKQADRDAGPFHPSPMNHGRLYPNLETIVEAGLVKKGEQNDRTNLYTITDDGKEALETRAAYLSN